MERFLVSFYVYVLLRVSKWHPVNEGTQSRVSRNFRIFSSRSLAASLNWRFSLKTVVPTFDMDCRDLRFEMLFFFTFP